MNIVYSNQPINIQENSLFLAGCSPRSKDVKSWRPEALKILENLGFHGTVYVPEWDNNASGINYFDQVEWEYAHLETCKVIVVWVPRKFPEMMGMITNVEFGSYVRSKRMIYGRPDWAEKCDYLDWLYTKITGCKPFNNLTGLLNHACLSLTINLK